MNIHKTIFLVALMMSIILTIFSGCSLAAGSDTTVSGISISTRPTIEGGSTREAIYKQRLTLPNGQIVTSEDVEPYTMQNITVSVMTLWVYPKQEDQFISAVGNHAEIRSTEQLSIKGIKAEVYLVFADREEPASAGSSAVTHECWLITFAQDPSKPAALIAYCIQIVFDKAQEEIIQDAKKIAEGWQFPI